MYRLFGIAIILCIIGQVYGHAALVTPKPWWWAASRERPCGGANYTSIPKAIWPVGSNQTLTWWVIAGDGMGTVRVRLNTAGTTDFSTNATRWLTINQPKIDKLGYFKITALIPNVQCTGPNNTCTMQMNTDSGGGWYSCTTIQIVCNGCEGGVPLSRDACVRASDLPFCDAKSGQQLLLPDGQSADQIDVLTRNTFNLNHNNPNVFANGNTTACMTLYKEMLCELYLAPCGNSSSAYTRQKCSLALSTCGLTSLHTNLYNCSVFPSAVTTTTAKSATTTTTAKTSTGTTTAKSTTTTTTTKTATTTTTKSSTTSKSLVTPDGALIEVDDKVSSASTMSFCSLVISLLFFVYLFV